MTGLEILKRILEELNRRDEFYQRGCSSSWDDDDTFAQGYSKCLSDLKGLFPVFLLRELEK
jgi:hypothetical protein